ncbi:MAG: GMC oxidoreductase [Halofilum sp. (in: g-proteobacteria)]|nr:GMC oxidoreductase [Halofilum sp. (in: g-proteobacteria)]
MRAIYRVSGIATLNERYHSLPRRIGMGLDYALRRRGPLAMAPSQLGMFTRSDPAIATPDLEYHVQPLSLDKFGDPLHTFPAFTASVSHLRPESRGYVRIRTGDATAAPEIAPCYLSTDGDRAVAARALRLTRRIVAQPALAPYRPEEYLPGAGYESDAELAEAAGDIGTTIFHPVATCPMGANGDPDAVLDSRLRVRGIDALRVVDASAMPNITSGNTASPTVMIAERGSDMIRADRG